MMNDFQDELQSLINKHSQENGSDTPDFILASYLNDCLKAFNTAVQNRETWYGRKTGPVEATTRDFPDPRHWQPVVEDCEACEAGYRLAPDGLHYNDEADGRTWGVCRKVVAELEAAANTEEGVGQ